MPYPRVLQIESEMYPKIKRIWWAIKKTKIFNWFRHSRLNPYHTFLTNIKASTLEEAKEKAYSLRKVQFLYKGTRYYSEKHCSVDEEFKKHGVVLRGRGNVADRIPRDKHGNLDLCAEEPIIISIIPTEGPALIGHASMQYKDRVVNRLITSIHTDPLYPKYEGYSEYYFLYPSKLGIEPKKLLREIDRHMMKKGNKKYNMINNNCAKNVVDILEKAGAKGIDLLGPDRLGIRFATPGNNPFNFGLKKWCFKYGVHVHPNEVEELHKRHPESNDEARRKEQDMVRERYYRIYSKNNKNKKTR